MVTVTTTDSYWILTVSIVIPNPLHEFTISMLPFVKIPAKMQFSFEYVPDYPALLPFNEIFSSSVNSSMEKFFNGKKKNIIPHCDIDVSYLFTLLKDIFCLIPHYAAQSTPAHCLMIKWAMSFLISQWIKTNAQRYNIFKINSHFGIQTCFWIYHSKRSIKYLHLCQTVCL